MMITGMCAADVSAAEKKTVTDYQAYAANLDKSAYSGNDLGASYSKKATTFKVWSPNAASVRVNIFEHGSDNEGDAGSIMSRAMSLDKTTGVWSVTINGDLLNKYYTYSVTHGKTTKETADVYAKACGVNGQRSMVVDLSTTNPEGWENDKHVLVQNQTDASVWEISVADFSSSESSGVSEANRGKYLAFTEEGTTVNGVQGASSTCVDYLKKLGVKYVQIMPFYDFGSVDESKNIMDQYNWGYDPVNYNCPEGSYSSNPKKGEVRIKECKQMIQALHNAGIGVIMDVVYNHTYTSDSWLQRTVPNYYYRMNNDGTFSNGSGCSNDTASEHLMFRKYMIDSVTYWASEYHIDGFRFDLMGLHDVTTMNSIRTALDNLYADGSGSRILMYGEAWDMATNCDEGTVLASQKNLKQLSDRIGAFDDTIRDAIKGSTGGTDGAFVQEGSRRANLKTGIAGQSDTTTGWANVPSQCVTYASCHDNLCLYDKLVGSVYGADGKYRKRYEDLVAMNKLSAAIVITSQGIPFSLGGEEFCRSKDGDENSYASSRKENMLDWENVDLYSDVIEYYRGLYKIRDAFAAFSDSTAATANSLTYLSDVPKGVMGYTINNTESGKWSQMCVIFNGSDSAQNVTAKGDWVVLADNKTAGLRNIKNVTNSVKVEAHSAVIMVDTKSYDSAGIMDDEGAVVIDYYDNKTEKLIKSQTLTGELGTSYDVTNLASTLNYDVKKTDGEIKGVFTDQVGHANDLLLEDRVHIALSDGVHMRYCPAGADIPPKYQLLIAFDDDSFLVFTVAMYGGINAFRDTLDNPYYLGALSKPSPLGDGFDAAYFDRLVAGAKPNLSAKAFLATQQRIPGLGNGVLQDILFNARIHPKRKMATLGERELDALFGAVKSTLAEMTAVGGRDTEKDLFGNSGGYKVVLSKNTYADPCPVCGGALVKEAYLGGAVYYCPHCQPLK